MDIIGAAVPLWKPLLEPSSAPVTRADVQLVCGVKVTLSPQLPQALSSLEALREEAGMAPFWTVWAVATLHI